MTGFADLDYQAMLDDIADPPTVVLLDTDGRARPGALTVEGLAALGERNPGASDGRAVDPSGPGDMLYTSGTTGSPKGVLVSHDAVLRTAFASALTRAYEDGRRILFSLPCYHMFGYVEGLLSVSFVGGAVIPQTTFSAEGYFAGIQRHRATDILCVPTMAVAMIEHPSRNDFDLSSLTAILCGWSPGNGRARGVQGGTPRERRRTAAWRGRRTCVARALDDAEILESARRHRRDAAERLVALR
jgi:fatty-acyl-CoA synthase